MRRRRFLAASVKLALGARVALLFGSAVPAALRAANDGAALDAPQLTALMLMARALLPHDFVADEKYRGVAQALDRAAAANTEQRGRLLDGLAALDREAGGDWLAATAEAKLAALEAVQDLPFFRTALHTAIETLYRDPDIYRRLGYEGSSIEFGGYLHRGFDDIDWLPPDSA